MTPKFIVFVTLVFIPSDLWACTQRNDRFSTTISTGPSDWVNGWSTYSGSEESAKAPFTPSSYSGYKREPRDGCMVWGPYAHTLGPATIYGTLYFKLKLHGLDKNAYAVRMDISADRGRKILVSRNFSVEDLDHLTPQIEQNFYTGELGVYRTYQTLIYESVSPLNDIEVRLCDVNPERILVEYKVYESILTLNYNAESATVVESDCHKE
jgi:hypothetical protein